MNDVVGYIRVMLPRYTEAGQRKAMATHSIEKIIQEGGKGKRANVTRSDLLRMSCPGRVFAVQHLFLLADPATKRKRGGTRADLWKAIDAIEAKEALIWELYTGLRTDTKQGRTPRGARTSGVR